MVNIFSKLAVAFESDLPFGLAWKRLTHKDKGHPFDDSELVDKLVSENHPHTGDEYIYTVNIRKCNDCGMIFFDNGLESRR